MDKSGENMSGKRLWPLLLAVILLADSLAVFSRPDSHWRRGIPGASPQVSRLPEPDFDGMTPTERVYRAWCILDADPPSKSACRLRRTLYENLQYMDWPAYGSLGTAGTETETIMALLDWLRKQDALSRTELTGLLLGAAGRSNLDGAYADGYSYSVTRAFIRYPDACCEILSGDGITDNDRAYIIDSIAYGAYPEDVYPQALAAAEHASHSGNAAILARLQQEM